MEKKKNSKHFLESGIQGLDGIFLGGLLRSNVVLIEGTPGAGKTTLGMEFIYRGAREFKEKGLIFSFDQSPERIKQHAQGFDWDLSGPERKNRLKIIRTTPAEILTDLASPEGFLRQQIVMFEAKRVFIDGLTAIKIFSETSFRENFINLAEALRESGVTTLISNEISEEIKEFSHEENFICDTVINLTRDKNRKSLQRLLEIKKARGQDFISGHHTMRILGDKGVRVYRRVQTRLKDYEDRPVSKERQNFGIPNLEEMLGQGIYTGSLTMAVGISGTGKTIMGIQFLHECLKNKGKALLVTLDEHPNQFVRNAQTLGINLEDYIKKQSLITYYESPLELHLDVHFENIIELVEKHHINRVVIDSLAAYQKYNSDEAQEFLYTLASYFKQKGVTAFYCYESPELLGLSQISTELKASTIADNIILLNYVEISTQMRRAITVPKASGSAIPQKTKEYQIERDGIKIWDDPEVLDGEVVMVPQLPLSSYYGVLSRAPARHSPVIENQIARGEKLPESVALS